MRPLHEMRPKDKKGMNQMNELKNAFYEVMYKYGKSFGETGVMANLEAWETSKASLLSLLRRHPNWVEKEKAIVFNYKENRELDRGVIDEAAYFIEEMAEEQIHEADEKYNFLLAFRAAITEYSSTLSDTALESIRSRGGIKCASGQKTSRIIGRLCRQFHLDTHKQYNSVYARLSDALNPLQINKTAVLSLHPCDFLEMSSKSSTWNSCHNLSSGSYQAGALSYMTDDVSMIFFTVDAEVKDHFYRAPRRTRQMFFFKDTMLYQSRLYPEDSADITDQNRGIVQKIISTCLDVPNRWTLKTKRDELSECCESGEGSRQYPDYHYQGNLSVLKGTEIQSPLVIGAKPICVCCGDRDRLTHGLKCNCEEQVVCQDCGRTVPRSNARYTEDAFHCNSCLHICAVCGSIIRENMYPAFDRRGNAVEICFDCYQASLEPCAACSVQGVCRIIGNSLCARTAIRYAA